MGVVAVGVVVVGVVVVGVVVVGGCASEKHIYFISDSVYVYIMATHLYMMVECPTFQ